MRIGDWSSDVCSSDVVVGKDCCHAFNAGENPRVALCFEIADGSEMIRDLGRQRRIVADREAQRGRDRVIGRHREERQTVRGVAWPGEGLRRRSLGIDQRAKRVAEPEELLPRSEEHTSELQSLMRSSYAVFSLKKK